jgi:ABC-type antimicrobial peptide transport system permease subunit
MTRDLGGSMSPTIQLAAHKLRAGWRGWAALALLIAIAGGAVLVAAAGAIRTDTAYPRFLAVSRAADALVAPAGPGVSGYDAALGSLPGVAASAPVIGINAEPVRADGTLDSTATVFAPLDAHFGRTIQIPRLLAGRLPAANAPGEVAVDQVAVSQLNLHVGSVLAMTALPNDPSQHARRITARVVGVFVATDSVVPVNDLALSARILASTALYRELGPDYEAFDGAYVTLRPGESLSALSDAAQTLTKRYPSTGRQVFVADQSVQEAAVERAIRPQAIALALFALALALTALLVVGQVAVRLLSEAAGDNAALAALGMTRRQLLAAGLAEVAAAVLAGAAGAVGIAVAASPLTPIGPARLAEPDPGISVNSAVLGIGFAAIVALLLARVAVTAWRQASIRAAIGSFGSAVPAAGPDRRPLLADRLALAGASLAAVTGVRFALDPGRGRDRIPVRSTLLGLAVAAAAVAGAVTFGTNLLRLVDTPVLYGQTWDVAFDGQFGTVTPQTFGKITGQLPQLTAETFGVHGTVSIGGQGLAGGRGAGPASVIPAIGLARGTGPLLSPTVLDGRAPRSAGEIVLGTSVLRQFGLRVGQHVTVDTPAGRLPMLITGSAVFPYFGQGSFTSTDVGEGAETIAAVLAPQTAASDGGQPGYNFALFSFSPGAKQAGIATLKRRWASFCASIQQSTCLVTSQRPNTVNNYAAIDGTPTVLAGVLAVLGLGVLAQFTVASARRRRRDYAVLKVLGLRRAQLRAIALWQASAVTAAALVIGIPLGVATGRWAWQVFASQAGLSGGAVTPLSVLWLIPAALAAAALVALPAARRVAALPAMVTLRTE